MERNELYDLLLDIMNIEDNNGVNENTPLNTLRFNSLAKLGAISILDAYANTIISAKDLENCKTIGDILDLAKL